MPKDESAKKVRRVFDTYRLINEGKSVTKRELADEFNVSLDTIKNYVSELKRYFNVDIENDGKRYIIKDGGDFEDLKNDNRIRTDDLISADDVVLIISALIQSNAFMETKMSIIRNSLLKALPPKEAKKLKAMLVFDKTDNGKDRIIEENVKKIRSAIAKEKKISFTYKDYDDKIKKYTMIPYSFACDLGKYYIIGKRDDTKTLKHMRIDRIIHKSFGTGRIIEVDSMNSSYVIKFDNSETHRNISFSAQLEKADTDDFEIEFINEQHKDTLVMEEQLV
ncbi:MULTISPECIES: helix-turn-helix transcriptional regulator [Clostridium]|uniref:helix-turn-helix transcriptional regulator n=1 Tax=Clostridium TaxID=1485 RepID=UPI0015E18C13|nr:MULTISPECIES: WYL domain-containing protein [Clostridium]MBN7575326.1 WYL domain-containing protein [Clostridium beijerinckii]MBN7580638.1 WYL domain-containing protein [Clostridium beijerinckii]MBN7585090.1 WYL domain-containing protein [Clostridium beijerinckii]MBO0520982.1 WYL domain-containing protein [Clostridium beijerinckii]